MHVFRFQQCAIAEHGMTGRRFSLGGAHTKNYADVKVKQAEIQLEQESQSSECEHAHQTRSRLRGPRRQDMFLKDRDPNPLRSTSTHTGLTPTRLFQPIGAGRRSQNLSASSRLTLRVLLPRRPRRHTRPSPVPDDFIPSHHADAPFSHFPAEHEPQIRLKTRQRSFSRMDGQYEASVITNEVTSIISGPQSVSSKDGDASCLGSEDISVNDAKEGFYEASHISNIEEAHDGLERATRPNMKRAMDVTLEARVRTLEDENSYLRTRVSHLLKIISGHCNLSPTSLSGFDIQTERQETFPQDDHFDRDDELHRLRRESRQLKASLIEVGRENERLCSTMATLRIKGVEQMRTLQDEHEELEERLASSRETCQRLEDALYHLRDCVLSTVDKSDLDKLADFHDVLQRRVRNVVSKLDTSEEHL